MRESRNEFNTKEINRRQFLMAAAGAAGSGVFSQFGPFCQSSASAAPKKLPIAAVITEYSKNSHADMIVGRVLNGYGLNGGPGPALKLVSVYTDQVPASDLSRGLSRKHSFHIATTIDEALTLGSDRLQVAGVLAIGEQGSYGLEPDTGQMKYPRRRFFEGIAACFLRVKETAPVFHDKHLSYNWNDAKSFTI